MDLDSRNSSFPFEVLESLGTMKYSVSFQIIPIVLVKLNSTVAVSENSWSF